MSLCKFQCVNGLIVCSICGRHPHIMTAGLPPEKYFYNCLNAKLPDHQQKLCPHFLGATLERTTITGCGCASNDGCIEVTVCECELEAHPRCIVFDRGRPLDPTIHLCSTCQDNPRNKSGN